MKKNSSDSIFSGDAPKQELARFYWEEGRSSSWRKLRGVCTTPSWSSGEPSRFIYIYQCIWKPSANGSNSFSKKKCIHRRNMELNKNVELNYLYTNKYQQMNRTTRLWPVVALLRWNFLNIWENIREQCTENNSFSLQLTPRYKIIAIKIKRL